MATLLSPPADCKPARPEAIPIPGVILPFYVGPDPDGETWAIFHYDAYPADPWEWPKALSIGDRVFLYRGHNSDSRTVCYSEATRPGDALAFPVA